MRELITLPGAVDLHVHLREPSNNDAETIESGTRAALEGGYALVCDMPNNPGRPTWSLERVEEKQAIIRTDALIPVAIYAGAQPESDNLGELAVMSRKSIGLKLYGAPTTGNEKDYGASDFADIITTWHEAAPDKPIMLHAGQDNLEDFIRLVAGEHRHHLHICHVNSAAEVELINRYKEQSLPLTCGVCPHHLFKTSHDVVSESWFAGMQPPLAHQDDAEKLLEMLANGQIDVVETDHAPHSKKSKWAAIDENPQMTHDPHHRTCFGVPGIEFALPLLFYQAKVGRISMERIVEVVATKPAEIIGVNNTSSVTWRMDSYRIENEDEQVISGSGFTPFLGKMAVGRVESARIQGKLLIEDGDVVGHQPKVINRGDLI